MKRITSRQNDVVLQYRRVARGDERSLLLLDGAHLISEALAAGITLRNVIAGDDMAEHPEIGALLDRLASDQVHVALASPAVMAAVSPVRSPSPIVAIADRPAANGSLFGRPPSLVVIACNVQDPGNLGAIARVTEAAGATGLIVAGGSADPFGWKALRGSMGSALRLPIAVHRDAEEAVEDARRHGSRVMAAVPRAGERLFDVNLEGDVALLIGGEGPGLSDALLRTVDGRITIPMHPPVESLNTAIAAALVLYEAYRQRTRP
jgi:TrmH family RNA methyltransferase